MGGFRADHRLFGSNVSPITLGTSCRRHDRNSQDRAELSLEARFDLLPSTEDYFRFGGHTGMTEFTTCPQNANSVDVNVALDQSRTDRRAFHSTGSKPVSRVMPQTRRARSLLHKDQARQASGSLPKPGSLARSANLTDS